MQILHKRQFVGASLGSTMVPADGKTIKGRRLQLGPSQEAPAFRCGGHRNYIGEKSPSVYMVIALAEAL